MVCFGVVVRHDKIKVFSRLCGKYLGNIKVPCKTLSAFQKVRFLQQQIARLCPHPKRSCEDLLLYVDQTQVGPLGMPYVDDLDEAAGLQVQQHFDGCTRLEMMWGEDDSYAESKVEQAGIHVTECGCCLDIELNGTDLPKELGYLRKKGKPYWRIWNDTNDDGTDICVDFSVFKIRYARSVSGSTHPFDVERLDLYGITPTNYMHCNVKHLCVSASGIDCQVFTKLDQIESLVLYNWKHSQWACVERNLKALTKLPNLKDLHLNYQLVTPQGASELLDAMALMPHVIVTDARCDVRTKLRNTQVDQKFRIRHLALVWIMLGLALAVGLTALCLGWPYLKARFS